MVQLLCGYCAQQNVSPALAHRDGVHGPPLVWVGSHAMQATAVCSQRLALQSRSPQHGSVEQSVPTPSAHIVHAPPAQVSGNLPVLQHW